MKKIENDFFFPKILDFFKFNNNNYLVEQMMGPDLYKLVNFVGINNLNKNTIYRIGIDLLYNIKMLHKKGYLHMDLKLDNIVSLLEPKKIDNYYIHFTIIDFGLSFQFKYKNGKYIEDDKWLKKRCGNNYFASIDALEGNPVGPKDDLFYICYILISLILRDKLPWVNKEGHGEKSIKKNNALKKKDFKIEVNINSQYKEIITLFKEIEIIEKYKEPNYKKYIDILKKGINYNENNEKNFIFEWENEIQNKKEKYSRIRSDLKDDIEIKKLFKGFPEDIIELFIKKF